MDRYNSLFNESGFYAIKVIIDKRYADDFREKIGYDLSWDSYDDTEYYDNIEFGFTKKDYSKYVKKILKGK